MSKKGLNFKSLIFKVFFTYSVVYLLAVIFRYFYDIESLISNFEIRYLIFLNMISIFLQGGLGNQLFQIFPYLSFCIQSNDRFQVFGKVDKAFSTHIRLLLLYLIE